MARRTKYNHYDDDVRATAVALTEIPGIKAADVADALAIHEVMLYCWRMEIRRGEIVSAKTTVNIDPNMKAELKRLRKLEQEHNLLKDEHNLLKQAIAFIDMNRAEHRLASMCRVYHVSPKKENRFIFHL